jgi:ubiquinone/menaquinone biosynthesis C-methylase UbiE
MSMDYSKQKRFFARAYSLGEKRFDTEYCWPLEVDSQIKRFQGKIKKEIPTGNILDLGCGQGRHTLYFAGLGYDAYGVDYVLQALKEARDEAKKRKLTNAHFIEMDVLNLDFTKNTFDIIVDWSVLDHIYPSDWDLYLENILSTLKIGGYLMITEFSSKDKRAKIFDIYDRGTYSHNFEKKELKKIFSKNFEFIELFTMRHDAPLPPVMLHGLLKKVS